MLNLASLAIILGWREQGKGEPTRRFWTEKTEKWLTIKISMYFSGITFTPKRREICIHSRAPGFLLGCFVEVAPTEALPFEDCKVLDETFGGAGLRLLPEAASYVGTGNAAAGGAGEEEGAGAVATGGATGGATGAAGN